MRSTGSRSALPGLLAAVAVVAALLLSAVPAPVAAAPKPGSPALRDRYIVVLTADAGDPREVARDLAKTTGLRASHVFRDALKGFSARIPADKVAAVERDPRVDYVAPDKPVTFDAQELPTGVDRIDADLNETAKIDNLDAGDPNGEPRDRVDVDVAIIDSGIDAAHRDLNYAGGYDCSVDSGGFRNASPHTDDIGHGTHVAGIVGALDNELGVVGVAPGARLWSVKIGTKSVAPTLASLVCAVDWVAANADTIEVANISADADGGDVTSTTDDGDDNNCGISNDDPLHVAICRSVAAGTTYAVSAGNADVGQPRGDAKTVVPAAYDEVITVSALEDLDGEKSGDDQIAPFSFGGIDVDLAAPGVNILSTLPQNETGVNAGTSFAAPHAAGAAALHIAKNGQDGPAAVRRALLAAAEPGPIVGDADGSVEGILNVGNGSAGPAVGVDLAPVSLRVQPTITVGQKIVVRWAGKITGTTGLDDHNQVDQLYFSSDAKLDSFDIPLAGAAPSGAVALGATYRLQQQTIPIPDRGEGRHYILVRLDDQGSEGVGRVAESDETNNVLAVPVRLATALPNLVPVSIDAPDVLVPGQPSSLTQTIRNDGPGDLQGEWRDRVFISGSPDEVTTFSYQEIELFTAEVREVAVGAADTYQRTNYFDVPSWAVQDLPDGTYYLITVADHENDVREGSTANEGDNRLLGQGRAKRITLSRTAKPDLVPRDLALTGPASVAPGDPIRLSYVLDNMGNAWARSPWLNRFVLSTDRTLSNDDRVLVDVTWGTTLSPGASVPRNDTLSAPEDMPPGKYYLMVEADTRNVIAEGDPGEANNVTSGPLAAPITIIAPPPPAKPDLVPTDLTAPASVAANSTIDVAYTLSNAGGGEAVPTWHDRFVLSTDGRYSSNNYFLESVAWANPKIAAGGSESRSVRLGIGPDVPPGDYSLLVESDAGNAVAESDDGNNLFVRTDKITITAPVPPKPDLVPVKLTVPERVDPDALFDITIEVENRGEGSATTTGRTGNGHSFWTDAVFLSTDDTLDPNDTQFARFGHEGEVAGGGTYSATARERAPGSAGNYFLIAMIDVDTIDPKWTVEESDEQNNTMVVPITFGEAPLPPGSLIPTTCKATSSRTTAARNDACDRKLGTYWSSAKDTKLPSAASVTFTLGTGGPQPIGLIQYQFERVGFADKMVIQVSDDGTTWRTLGTVGNATKADVWQPIEPIAPSGVTAKYVRFKLSSTKDVFLGYLREVEFRTPKTANAQQAVSFRSLSPSASPERTPTQEPEATATPAPTDRRDAAEEATREPARQDAQEPKSTPEPTATAGGTAANREDAAKPKPTGEATATPTPEAATTEDASDRADRADRKKPATPKQTPGGNAPSRDETAPEVRLVTPAVPEDGKDAVVLGATARFAASVTEDGGSGVAKVVFQARPAEGGKWTTIGSDRERPFEQRIDLSKLRAGAYKVRAVVTDRAGNKARSEPIPVTVLAGRPDPKPSPGSGPVTAEQANADDGPTRADSQTYGSGEKATGDDDGGAAVRSKHRGQNETLRAGDLDERTGEKRAPAQGVAEPQDDKGSKSGRGIDDGRAPKVDRAEAEDRLQSAGGKSQSGHGEERKGA